MMRRRPFLGPSGTSVFPHDAPVGCCERAMQTEPVEKWRKIERFDSRGVAQPGSAPALGAGGRWFESSRPDHFSRVLFRSDGWQFIPNA